MWFEAFESVGFMTWAGLVVRLMQHYSLAHIGYKHFVLRESKRARFWLRSFEAIEVKGEILVDISNPAGIRRVDIAAGPWCQRPPIPLDDDDHIARKVRVVFSGFPAEGTVQMDVWPLSTSGDGTTLEIPRESPTQVRDFYPISDWNIRDKAKSFLWRWFSGLLGSLVGYAGLRALFLHWLPDSKWNDVDYAIVALIAMASIATCAFAIPIRGKAITCGYRGGVDERSFVAPEQR